MAVAVNRENYTLHKLHSLAGIFPVGYYLAQHLFLNTFSLAGPAAFDGVVKFFNAMPFHLLWALKIFFIYLPLLFHAGYGFAIVARAKFNNGVPQMQHKENRYFAAQRISGVIAFLFLLYHVTSTSINATLNGHELVYYDTWRERLSSFGYGILVVYIIGVLTSTYHLSYGLWSFCIRWGITISESAQQRLWKVSMFAFFALSGLGLAALFGFFVPVLESKKEPKETVVQSAYSQPLAVNR
jgi:succinate dehydrogenase / fumarate reductase, cytochrome b subunit